MKIIIWLAGFIVMFSEASMGATYTLSVYNGYENVANRFTDFGYSMTSPGYFTSQQIIRNVVTDSDIVNPNLCSISSSCSQPVVINNTNTSILGLTVNQSDEVFIGIQSFTSPASYAVDIYKALPSTLNSSISHYSEGAIFSRVSIATIVGGSNVLRFLALQGYDYATTLNSLNGSPYTATFSIPISAAAWLFGFGLLAIAGASFSPRPNDSVLNGA